MKSYLTSRAAVGHLVLIVLALVLGHYINPVIGLAPLMPVAFGVLLPPAVADIGRQLAAWGFADPSGGLKGMLAVPKTANYTVLDPFTALTGGDPSGTLFTNRGAAGAVTFTLPAVVPRLAGVYYDFVGFANQTWGVAAAAGTVCTFNNAAAASVTCSTAGAKIGAHIRAWCDGTSWHVNGDTVGVTYTVA